MVLLRRDNTAISHRGYVMTSYVTEVKTSKNCKVIDGKLVFNTNPDKNITAEKYCIIQKVYDSKFIQSYFLDNPAEAEVYKNTFSGFSDEVIKIKKGNKKQTIPVEVFKNIKPTYLGKQYNNFDNWLILTNKRVFLVSLKTRRAITKRAVITYHPYNIDYFCNDNHILLTDRKKVDNKIGIIKNTLQPLNLMYYKRHNNSH